jgi:hypothetical protein
MHIAIRPFHPKLAASLVICLSLLLSACGAGNDFATGGTVGGVTGTSSVQLTWEAPNQNTDSSCLNDLAGYHFNYGTSMGVYTNSKVISVSNISCSNSTITNACGIVQTCTYKINNVPSGILYIALQAYNNSGVVSSDSNVVSKMVQ